MRFSLNLANSPRKLLPQVKGKLRQKVPLLTANELRRAKGPLYKVLLTELKEEGRPKAIQIYEKILETDKKHKNQFKKKENHKILLQIFKFLVQIDEQTWEEEVDCVTKLSWSLWHLNENFDWLVECILIFTIGRVAEYKLEGTKADAFVKFTHGMSLYHRLKWLQAALVFFEYSFHLAQHNENWTFNNQNLSSVIKNELASCSIDFSKELRQDKSQINEALVFSKRALTLLRQELNEETILIEILAEMEYASCWVDCGQYERALSHFEHAAALADKYELKEKKCECLIEISKCFKFSRNFTMQGNYLHKAKEIAEENSLTIVIGMVMFEILKFYMFYHDSENFEKCYNETVKLLTMTNDREKLAEVDAIYAQYQAKPHFNSIVDTVLKIDKKQSGKNSDLENFINWIDNKSPDIFKIDSENEIDYQEFVKKFLDPDEVVEIAVDNENERNFLLIENEI